MSSIDDFADGEYTCPHCNKTTQYDPCDDYPVPHVGCDVTDDDKECGWCGEKYSITVTSHHWFEIRTKKK